jgi:hypothetical protein
MVIVRMCEYFIADFGAVRSHLDMFLWCTVDRVVGLYHAESIPSQAKVLTRGGDLREAQVDVPLSVIHSCV